MRTRRGMHVRKRVAMLAALVFVLALVASACGGGNEGSASPTTGSSSGESEGGTMTIGSEQANDHGTKDVSGRDEIELELDSFYFEPTVLTGTPGQSIKLELGNESDAEHNFSITDLNIDQDVEAGEDADVMVTFPDSGSLVFFCKYHRTQGMLGELTSS
jgi:plastocyanin